MSGRQGLIFRQDYFDDPAAWQALKELLIDIFNVDIGPLDRLGGHDRTSFPSAYFDADGQCVANLSAFSMPLVINGRPVKAAGWQSGAVRPDYRGRGLYRALMEITLKRCEQQGFEAIVLYTDKPGLYEPHGFRVVPQYSFKGPTPRRRVNMPKAIDLNIEIDIDLIRRLLAHRSPVSRRLAVADQARLFLLNCVLIEGVRLSLMADQATIIAWRLSGEGVFELLDLVGTALPDMGEILSALDLAPLEIECLVPPDRLSWDCQAVADTGSLVFMMRAPDELLPAEPSCLSPLADF